MGGDHAPACVVEGALLALRDAPGRFSVVLVGRQGAVADELARLGGTPAGLTVVHAPEVIAMDDPPTVALKAKKHSSIAVGLGMVRDASAQAFVSAGNTGAVFSASTLILGRLTGVGRPTIGALIPTSRGRTLLIDAGANVDCRAQHLFEFAVMGSIYMTSLEHRERPTIGLLNIGEEDAKGNEVSQEAFRLLRASSLNFRGNIEGRDLLSGEVDVAVCDGFVGNIILKFGESVPAFLKAKVKAFAARNPLNALVALIAGKGLRSSLKELDYQEHGGVPVLGVRGVSIIGHGGSTPKAIKNMILRAEEMILRRVETQIQETLRAHHG